MSKIITGIVEDGDEYHIYKRGRHTHTCTSQESAETELYNGIYHQLRMENDRLREIIEATHDSPKRAIKNAELTAELDAVRELAGRLAKQIDSNDAMLAKYAKAKAYAEDDFTENIVRNCKLLDECRKAGLEASNDTKS